MNRSVNAILADDEPHLLTHLRHLLNQLWPELKIVAEAVDGIEAKKILEQHTPDLAFLDIRMPGLSGLEVARSAPENCRIIFITAYDEYAIEAFEEAVVDYILKPVSEKRLYKTINRLKKRFHLDRQTPQSPAIATLALESTPQENLKWIKAKQGQTIRIIPVETILFFQAEEKYTKVVTEEEEFLIRTPIKTLHRELDNNQFWCIHRSTIINVQEIKSVSKSLSGRFVVHLKNHPARLTTSRRFGHLFKQM